LIIKEKAFRKGAGRAVNGKEIRPRTGYTDGVKEAR